MFKEDIDINEETKIMKLKTNIDSLGISLNTLMLSPDSREVAVHITRYTGKKYLKKKSRVAPVVKCILWFPSEIQIMNT